MTLLLLLIYIKIIIKTIAQLSYVDFTDFIPLFMDIYMDIGEFDNTATNSDSDVLRLKEESLKVDPLDQENESNPDSEPEPQNNKRDYDYYTMVCTVIIITGVVLDWISVLNL